MTKVEGDRRRVRDVLFSKTFAPFFPPFHFSLASSGRRWMRSTGCATLKIKLKIKIKLCHDKGGRGA